MKLYLIRNKEGKFFRAKGRDGHGESWVADIEKARIYTKPGQAKSRVTFFFKENPEYGCPDILEFELDVSAAKVIEMTQITNKSILNIKKKELERKNRDKQYRINSLKEEQEEIVAELQSLS